MSAINPSSSAAKLQPILRRVSPTVGAAPATPQDPAATFTLSRAARVAQSASLKAAGGPDLPGVAHAVATAKQALADLEGALGETPGQPGPSAKIAAFLRQIDDAAKGANAAAAGAAGIEFKGVAQQVAAFHADADLEPGEKLDVVVAIAAPPEKGALDLSFQDQFQLDLGGPDELFTIEVSGPLGSQELSFASGTSYSSIANAINAFSNATGVKATINVSNVVSLSSTEFGSDAFVGVKVVDDAGAAGAGIIRPENEAVSFDSPEAAAGVNDFGADIDASVNNQPAEGDGAIIKLQSEALSLAILLNDFDDGVFRAFQLVGAGAATEPTD